MSEQIEFKELTEISDELNEELEDLYQRFRVSSIAPARTCHSLQECIHGADEFTVFHPSMLTARKNDELIAATIILPAAHSLVTLVSIHDPAAGDLTPIMYLHCLDRAMQDNADYIYMVFYVHGQSTDSWEAALDAGCFESYDIQRGDWVPFRAEVMAEPVKVTNFAKEDVWKVVQGQFFMDSFGMEGWEEIDPDELLG